MNWPVIDYTRVEAAAVGPEAAAASQVETRSMARRAEAASLHQPRAVVSGKRWSTVLEASLNVPWATPPDTASTTSSRGLQPSVASAGGIPWYPQMPPQIPAAPPIAAAAPPSAFGVAQAPPLPPAAAEGAAHLAGPALTDARLWDERLMALNTYAPALQALGLQHDTLLSHAALPGGPQLLAEMTRYLPILNACGVDPVDASRAVTQAAGHMDISTLGTYVPVLLHLGWAKDDILQLATAPTGAQALAELTQFAPALLARNYLRPILAQCALVPGALAVLTSEPPIATATSAAAPTKPSLAVDVQPRLAGQPLFVPISFTRAERSYLCALPRGEERVGALDMFHGHLDSARLDRADLFSMARSAHGAHKLALAKKLAPAFFHRGIDINSMLAILMLQGGTLTLETLDEKYSALQMLGFDAEALVRMATRPSGRVWLKALLEHTEALYRIGWAPEDILLFAKLPQAHFVLETVRTEGEWLWSKGFTVPEQMAFIKMGRVAEHRRQAQVLWPRALALGFRDQQIKTMVLVRLGTETLASVIECAPLFLAAGFSAQQFLQIVEAPEGKIKLESLRLSAPQLLASGYTHHDLVTIAIEKSSPDIYAQLHDTSSSLAGLGISCETLLRVASHAKGALVLRIIKRHWEALRSRVSDAERRMCGALETSNDAEDFERWMVKHAA